MNKSKYFSLAFFRDTFRRVNGSFAFLVISVIVITVINGLANLSMDTSSILIINYEDVTASSLAVMVFAPILTAAAFEYLMKRSSEDFYEALPIKRTAMAASTILAVFTMVAGVITLSSVLGVLISLSAIAEGAVLNIGPYLLEYLKAIISSLFAISAVSVAMAVVGTKNCGAFSMLLILAAPRIVLGAFNAALVAIYPMLVSGYVNPLFDSDFNLYISYFTGTENAWLPAAYIYTALLSVAYLILAVKLFNERKSEYASHSFASASARYVARILLGLSVSAWGILLALSDKDLIPLGILVIVLGFVAYSVHAALTKSSEKNRKASLISLGVFLVLNIAFGVGALSVTAIEKNYSPSAEDIDGVSFISNDYIFYLDYQSFVDAKAQGAELEDEETKKLIADAIARGYNFEKSEDREKYTRQTSVKIREGSRTVYRTVYLSDEEYKSFRLRLGQMQEYKDIWLDIENNIKHPSITSHTITLGSEAVDRVMQSMVSEVRKIGFDTYYESYMEGSSVGEITCVAELGGKAMQMYVSIPEGLTETAKILEEERNKAAESKILEIEKMLLEAASGERDPINLYVYAYHDKLPTISMQIDVWVDPELSDAETLISELKRIASPSVIPDESEICISLYEDGVFGESEYLCLGISDGMQPGDVKAFFEKFGFAQDYGDLDI